MIATIHLARVNQPTRIFQEGFVKDDGNRLITRTSLPDEIGNSLTAHWLQAGWLPVGRSVSSIVKYLFYQENFQIMEIRDRHEQVIGYYCDITTPLQKINGEYFLLDLIVDVCILPDLTYKELDWDEWQSAREAGLLTEVQVQTVDRTIQRIRQEIPTGAFPLLYLRQENKNTSLN